MKNFHAFAVSALAMGLMLSPSSQAADMVHGEKLFKESCTTCHGAEMFSRKNRKVNDPSGLKTMVQACATNLSLSWFEDDVDAVTAYMNREFYTFK